MSSASLLRALNAWEMALFFGDRAKNATSIRHRQDMTKATREWLDAHFAAVEERMKEQGPVDFVSWLRLRG